MKTKSEILFEDYCKNLHYVCNPIIAGSDRGKTPDYEVVANGRVIVEIKELTPNKDDERQAKELRQQRWTSGGGIPGKRIYDHIKAAASQLKRYRDSAIPCVLLLYDNIVVDGMRPHIPNSLLGSAFIDFAMYGLQTVFLSSEEESQLVRIPDGRGGRRQMTIDERTYISAVAVLYEESNAAPFIVSYHNFFAKESLPFDIFAGPRDRHFVKPSYPDQTPQEWVEAKDTRST